MGRSQSLVAVGLLGVLAAGLAGCGSESPIPSPPDELPTKLVASTTDTRFQTADHMLAAIEMQISGEPFAELIGRDLGGYDRFSAQEDNYLDPATNMPGLDPLGFSMAVETYEYSKQTMNAMSFELGAGLSLQYGPVQNPANASGDAAFTLLLDRIQKLGKASRASGAKFGKDFVASPPPPNDPTNYYGWPGIWPVYAEFRSFDPTVHPAVGADHECSLAGATDEPIPPGTVQTFVGDYECDANTLHLVDREAQVEKVLAPDALGYATWKQALWTINYWGSMHDIGQNPITVVPEGKLKDVGEPDNAVVGQFPSPLDPTGMELVFGKDGTFLGGVSLEGFQGLVMLDEMDNKSALLLKSLVSSDGSALAGYASYQDAIDYDYQAKLRYWPAAVNVTEKAVAKTPAEVTKYFPQPTGFSIASGDSRLQDLSALLGGFGTVFAMTDVKNEEFGGTQQFRATFDGSPYAADDPMVSGEDTLHDRALGILKTAFVDLDRLHFDADHKVLVDTVTVSGDSVTRGSTVSTIRAAYAILGMRTALRGMNGSLSLYGNDTPDSLGIPILLDQSKLGGAPFSGTVAARLVALIKAEADFISTKLLDADGVATNSIDLKTGARDGAALTVEAQAAAIRGLLEAYVATSDQSYRNRAIQAYAALESKFWMDDVSLYRTTADESMTMKYTSLRMAALQGALRQYYKLVASTPGQEDEAKKVLDRVLSLNKRVLNGWNDLNKDGVVQQPDECMGARLQMAERALTGEFSIAADNGDRDHDCVPDIATEKLPATLAAEIVIERKK
ncbi:MAG: hypothetical protein U0359_09950 [Byssovorax sp.]